MSKPRAVVWLEGLVKIKKCNDLIGNRTPRLLRPVARRVNYATACPFTQPGYEFKLLCLLIYIIGHHSWSRSREAFDSEYLMQVNLPSYVDTTEAAALTESSRTFLLPPAVGQCSLIINSTCKRNGSMLI
jgi:hypothetical protein